MALKKWLERLQQAEDAGAFSLEPEQVELLRGDMQQYIKEKDDLQIEFDELNHMLTHQPPSAWAKREKKYHDDKKIWDSKEADFTKQKARMLKEINELKADNRLVSLTEAKDALDAECKELREQFARLQASYKAKTEEADTSQSALAKLEAEHAETVRENVRESSTLDPALEMFARTVKMNMAQVKMDSEVREKNAEAAADKNRAEELTRLLDDLKSKYNESHLKAAGLSEQLESSKARLSAEREAHAAEKEELIKSLTSLQDSSLSADSAQQVLRDQLLAAHNAIKDLESQNAELTAQLGAAEARVTEEQARYQEKVSMEESAAIAALRLEVKSLKDAQSHWEGDRVALKNESRALRAQLTTAKSSNARGMPSSPAPSSTADDSKASVPRTHSQSRIEEASNINVLSGVQALNQQGGKALTPQDTAVIQRAGFEPLLDRFYQNLASLEDFSSGVTVASAVGEWNDKGGRAPVPITNGALHAAYASNLGRGLGPGGAPLTTEQLALLQLAASKGMPAPDDSNPESWAAATGVEVCTGISAVLSKFDKDSEGSQWARIGSTAAALDASVHLDGTKLSSEEVLALESVVLQASDTFPELLEQWNKAIASQAVPSVIARAIVTGKVSAEGTLAECMSNGVELPEPQLLLLRAAATSVLTRSSAEPEATTQTRDVRASSARQFTSDYSSTRRASSSPPLRPELQFADLASGRRSNGSVLASEDVARLRDIVTEQVSSTPQLSTYWQSLPDDSFMASYAATVATRRAMYPAADSPGAQLLKTFTDAEMKDLRRAAVPVGLCQADQVEAGAALPRVLTGSERAQSGNVLGTSEQVAEDGTSSDAKESNVGRQKKMSLMDFTEVPDSPVSRALRQYAAEKELETELHQEQVNKLMNKLQEKDEEMAELENRMHQLATASQATSNTLFDSIFGAGKKAQDRIKQLETQLKHTEERMRYYELTMPTTLPTNALEPPPVFVLEKLAADNADPDAAREAEKAYWMGENGFLMNQLVQVKLEMAERNSEYMGNKRALARSLEKNRALVDTVEELQFQVSQLQDECDNLRLYLGDAAPSHTPKSFSNFMNTLIKPMTPRTHDSQSAIGTGDDSHRSHGHHDMGSPSNIASPVANSANTDLLSPKQDAQTPAEGFDGDSAMDAIALRAHKQEPQFRNSMDEMAAASQLQQRSSQDEMDNVAL